MHYVSTDQVDAFVVKTVTYLFALTNLVWGMNTHKEHVMVFAILAFRTDAHHIAPHI